MLNSGLDIWRDKNEPLLLYGVACLLAAIGCMVLIKFSSIQVSGINAWIKPFKFFLSVSILSFTLAMYLPYLDDQKQVHLYCVNFIVFFTLELLLIAFQAARGRRSHYNIDTPVDRTVFALMGLAIIVVLVHTVIITAMFFTQKQFRASDELILAIRLSLVLLVVFAMEGFVMSALLRHTIGSKDGTPGIPVLNWSRTFGDLRVAHFFGMHAIQIIPLLTIAIANSKKDVYLISFFYFVFVTFTLIQALMGKSFIK